MKVPYRDARRRAIGWNFEGTANLIETTRKAQKKYMREPKNGKLDYNSLDGLEQKHFDKAMQELASAEKRLRALAKRCMREREV